MNVLEDVHMATDDAQEALRSARRQVSRMDADSPETLDAREELTSRARGIGLRVADVTSAFAVLANEVPKLPRARSPRPVESLPGSIRQGRQSTPLDIPNTKRQFKPARSR